MLISTMGFWRKPWSDPLPRATHRPLARPVTRAVLFSSWALAAAACQKPENDLGLDLLDPSVLMDVVVVDTTTLIAFTREEVPVRTSGLSRNALGSYLDHDFGLTRAGIVTQFRLSSNNVGAGQNNHGLVADSLVLSLVYDMNSYAYGNLGAQKFRVLEIDGSLHADSIYRTDHAPEVANLEDLVRDPRGVFTPDPFTSPVVGGDTLKPQLRIALQQELADRLLAAWGTADLADNNTFQQFFKGLWIAPDNESPMPFELGVLYFNLLHAESRMTLYYRVVRPGEEDTLTYDFVINENCVRYTHCTHAFEQAIDPFLSQSLEDTTLGQMKVHVQSLGGVRAEVRFPNLDRYAHGGLEALAKAELVIPIAQAYYPYYQPPSQLFVYRKGDEGQDLFLPDQLLGGVDGFYDMDAREYRFNVTLWMQGVMSGTYANTGLSFVPSGMGVSANRAILAGPAHPVAPMRLQLTFTTY